MIEQIKNTCASKSYKTMSSIDKTFSEGLANAIAFVYKQVNKRKLAFDSLIDKTVQESIIFCSKTIKSCVFRGYQDLSSRKWRLYCTIITFWCGLTGRMKLTRDLFNVNSLCGDISTLTCIANDFDYERVFSRQREGLAKEGDVFI